MFLQYSLTRLNQATMIKQTQFPFADKKQDSALITFLIVGGGAVLVCVTLNYLIDKYSYELKNETP